MYKNKGFFLSKVTVRLLGGLGNQMFQYATARALAYKSNAELILDISWYNIAKDREFALNSMNIVGKVLNKKPSKFLSNQLSQRIISKLYIIYRKYLFNENVFHERFFYFDPEVANLYLPVYLDGYFQSEKYFSSIRGIISSEFTLVNSPNLSNQMMLDDMNKYDSICVHVRRGDYAANPVTNVNHGLCSFEYYYQAIEMLSTKLSNPHCYIFSDDIDWVRSNFELDTQTTIVDINNNQNAHED